MSFRSIELGEPAAREVEAMVDQAFGFYGAPFWRWKYADPDGPSSLVVIAEEGQDVVGCAHYLAMTYQLGQGRYVRGLAAGDLFVKKEFRRRQLASDLSMEARRMVTEARPDAAFVTMLTWRALGAHYERQFGYTRVRSGYRLWSKRVSWAGQVAQIVAANPELAASFPTLQRVDHVLRLELRGAPPLVLHVGPEGFLPHIPAARPRLRIRATNANLFKERATRSILTAVVAAVLTGRIRVWGSPRAMFQALRVAGAYRAAARSLQSS